MKRTITKILLIFSTVLLLSACVNDDMSNCPYNTVLRFRYNADGTSNVFNNHVSAISVYVYRNDGTFVMTKTVPVSELGSDYTLDFKLDPGSYHFVCWGNALTNTSFDAVTSLSDARLQHPNLASGADIPTNDPLYFGSCDLSADNKDITEKEVILSSAHVNLEIYLKGAVDDPDHLPVIEVQDVIPQYDFAMNAVGTPVGYFPVTNYVNTTEMPNMEVVKLQVPRFADDNALKIDVRDPANPGQSIYTLNLKQFMSDNNLHVEGIQEVTLQIQMAFNELGVVVTIPSWGDEPILPETPRNN